MVSAILLAAGRSERMGAFKQLLPLGTKTFVECCVDNLLASAVAEVVVVTGHNHAAVEKVLEDRPVRFAHNPDYRSGMAGSIIRGFRSVSTASNAVMIALADQPLIQTDVMDRLISVYCETGPAAVVPRYLGANGHPIIVNRRLAGEIESMDLTMGLREVLRAYTAQTEYVEVGTESVLVDFDYPEDYQRIEAARKE
jgi:molybdenum cofactor cytidylyltransferase